MSSEVMPPAVSTKTITEMVTDTAAAIKNNIASATPNPGMDVTLSPEFFDNLIGNATTVAAGKLGLDYIDMEQYIPTIRRLITALVMGGTVGGALALGKKFYSSGQIRREQAGRIKKQAGQIRQQTERLGELADRIGEQAARITELETEKAPLQDRLAMEISSRKEAEAKVHELKKAMRNASTHTPSRSILQARSNLPLTPREQARRKSYKDMIEANTHLLLEKKVTADKFADEIYEKVRNAHTPLFSNTKRKLLGDPSDSEEDDEVNTLQAYLMDSEARASQPTASLKHQRSEDDMSETASGEESPSKRARTSATRKTVEGHSLTLNNRHNWESARRGGSLLRATRSRVRRSVTPQVRIRG
jgi:hypothetical protein